MYHQYVTTTRSTTVNVSTVQISLHVLLEVSLYYTSTVMHTPLVCQVSTATYHRNTHTNRRINVHKPFQASSILVLILLLKILLKSVKLDT